MKKFLSTITLSFCFVCSIFSAPKAPVLTPIDIEPVIAAGEINNFIIDPRAEVIGTICRLAELDGFTYYYQGDNAFLGQMNTLFEKYKDHKAVKTVKNLAKKGIDSSALYSLAYHIKPDFSGTIIDFSPFPETLYHTWEKIGTKATYDFVKQIHDFASDTNFKRIYALNSGTYISDVGYMKNDIEKAGIAQWANEFFNYDEFQNPTIVVSRLGVGFNYYDFAIGTDGKRLAYLTTFPGTYYNTLESCYINFYTQTYASKNWKTIKDNYIKYNKAYAKKFYPEMTDEEINKMDPSDYDVAVLMSTYSWLVFLQEKQPEDHPSYEEVLGAIEKQVGDSENILGALYLIQEYASSRDKYPSISDFEPRLNEFFNSLELAE